MSIYSSDLEQPVSSVNSEGQTTCSKVTLGLSAFSNQSNLKSQPFCNSEGKLEQALSAEIPPYCSPQEYPDPNSFVQPLVKIPTPPPGKAKSN
ncbi:unnamed protein product [Ambrosiozyma monospora]|uniref:Unnamed protein product n=1 Tax=Ambrosiozyma monospora TaxID=43982 RepID=A0A9W6WEC5_AMBMO|nr:unnamed protein product [Ambrosiozyma monospora]